LAELWKSGLFIRDGLEPLSDRRNLTVYIFIMGDRRNLTVYIFIMGDRKYLFFLVGFIFDFLLVNPSEDCGFIHHSCDQPCFTFCSLSTFDSWFPWMCRFA